MSDINGSEIRSYYSNKHDSNAAEIKRLNRWVNIYSAFRLIIILAGLVLFYHSLKPDGFWLPVITGFATILGFALLVSRQMKVQKKLEYFRLLNRLIENELSTMEGRSNLYDDGIDMADERHPYTADLDVFGKFSLFELVNRCTTSAGRKWLASWLLSPSRISEIELRQEAVRELGSMTDWRLNFQTSLFDKANEHETQSKMIGYLDSTAITPNRLLSIYVKYIPVLFLIAAILAGLNSIFYLLVILLGIINMILMQAYNPEVLKTDQQLGKMSSILKRLSAALDKIGIVNWKSKLSAQMALELRDSSDNKLPAQVRKFSALINNLNFGLSTIGPVLNFVMAWNVRQLFAIDSWKKSNKENLATAFSYVGQFEALSSLSSLSSNNPNWNFPVLSPTENFTLQAQGISHPLISVNERIANDYYLEDDHKIDIVTGSNMAGKSTFLRTLGINVVLALAGAPVCANKMELSWMNLYSYMRIKDSLHENTSTFKAELDRLDSLLRAIKSGDKIFFLIDEMLRGTNSVDKFEGSRAVIRQLIKENAVGMIATHDLQIAELEVEYPDYIRNFHFDIQMQGDEMQFDYKLKTGPCKTFNAKLLLSRLGIEI